MAEEQWNFEMPPLATILVVARNAAATIERAIGSAMEQGPYPIVMVDDDSSDDTVARVKALAGERARIVPVDSHGALGSARQRGLEAIETEYGVLLDADDALLPGRVDRLVATMESEGADAVFDEVELYEEKGDRLGKVLLIPGFLNGGDSLCRLFERNYLPGIGQMGFRAAVFKKIGYDTQAHGPEDTDIVLRALAAGVKISLIRKVGYRMYHSPDSVSRDLNRQNAELARVLRKHDYDQVASMYRNAGYTERIGLWGRHSLATFRGDLPAMAEFLGLIEESPFDWDSVMEPEGPVPMTEKWRIGFARGVLCLLEEDARSACSHFQAIVSEADAAEVFNNWGVAETMLGRWESARERFEKALEFFPGYADATQNLRDASTRRITQLPLRRQPSRNLY